MVSSTAYLVGGVGIITFTLVYLGSKAKGKAPKFAFTMISIYMLLLMLFVVLSTIDSRLVEIVGVSMLAVFAVSVLLIASFLLDFLNIVKTKDWWESEGDE